MNPPNDESLERLHVVNKMRDLCFKNSEKLAQAGILAVLLFGSTLEGNADEDSDIDICVVTQEPKQKTNFKEYVQDTRNLERLIAQVLEPSSHFPVSFASVEDRPVIHVNVEPLGSASELPTYAPEAIRLWTKQS